MTPASIVRAAALAAAAAFAVQPTTASEPCTADAMIVFDGSGSMSEMGFNQLGEPRIFAARRAVREVMPQIAPYRRLGLIVYGPGPTESCANIDTRFPPTEDAGDRIVAEIDTLAPSGNTPLTDAVEQAAEVLEFRKRPGVVVLVTDGAETCFGEPCQLAARLAAEARDLTVHVIGFQVRGEFFSWDGQAREGYMHAIAISRCLADRTGGTYTSAESTEDLVAALRETLGCMVIGRL